MLDKFAITAFNTAFGPQKVTGFEKGALILLAYFDEVYTNSD